MRRYVVFPVNSKPRSVRQSGGGGQAGLPPALRIRGNHESRRWRDGEAPGSVYWRGLGVSPARNTSVVGLKAYQANQ